MFRRNKEKRPVLDVRTPEEVLKQRIALEQRIADFAAIRDELKQRHSDLLLSLKDRFVPILGLGHLTLNHHGGVINIDESVVMGDVAVERINYGVYVGPHAIEVDVHTRNPRTNHIYLSNGPRFEADGVALPLFDPEAEKGLTQLENVCGYLRTVALSQCVELVPTNPAFATA